MQSVDDPLPENSLFLCHVQAYLRRYLRQEQYHSTTLRGCSLYLHLLSEARVPEH